MKEKVEKILNEIRPHIQMDGGDVEFVGLEGKTVKVKLKGACSHCPGAMMTLKFGIERKIREALPEIESVEAV